MLSIWHLQRRSNGTGIVAVNDKDEIVSRCARESYQSERACRSGQDSPIRWARRSTASGTNFSLFSEVAERVELCLFDEHGAETRVDLPEMTALCWHGYRARTSRPGQRYGFRVHGPWASRSRAALQSRQAAARSLREGDRRAVGLGRGRLPVPRSTSPSRPATSRQRAVRAASPSSSTRTSTGATTARRDTPWHQTVIYETHVKGFTQAPSRHPGGAARHLRRPGAPRRDRLPAAARHHRRRAAAGAPVRAGLDAARAEGCATTGATTRSASSRRTTSTRAARPAAASRSRSSSRWSRRCTTPGSR